MIVFVMTAKHRSTHAAVRDRARDLRIRLAGYGSLLVARALPRATYVFTDFDRLPPASLGRVEEIYRTLRERGLRVLNDPARAVGRYELLRRLHGCRINDFNAYRVEDGWRPRRWPVFLRREGDHKGPLSGLLHSSEELEREIGLCLSRGVSHARLLVVEFAAEPVRPGLYRKLSTYRIGETGFADTCVHEQGWVARIGKDGIAPAELYEDELRIVRENPYGAVVSTAFDIAGVEYGRCDFGLVGGKPQIYEINTNPNIELLGDSPSPFRSESRRLANENYLAALRRIDTPDDGGIIRL